MKQNLNSRELLKWISSKQKLIKIERKNIQKLEEKVATLGNQQDYTFDILLKSWMLSLFSDHYRDMATIILLGSLIHPLTAEIEWSFSLMKLICTRLRNRLLTENLSHCMRVCKFRDLRADEYEQILRLWLKEDETKKERFHNDYNNKFFTYMFNFFIFYVFIFW